MKTVLDFLWAVGGPMGALTLRDWWKYRSLAKWRYNLFLSLTVAVLVQIMVWLIH